jgi:hypothetical protein
MKTKQETISLLPRALTGVHANTVLPKLKGPEGVDCKQEFVLLDILKPKNGSYIMNISSCHNDDPIMSSPFNDRKLNAEELFEAWMVMGHTIKHLVGDYKKELIEYMVKEYRTRQQEEDNV